MQWLNAMAERGIKPVMLAAAKVRQATRQAVQEVRDKVAESARAPQQMFDGLIRRGLEPLEARTMLAVTPVLTGSSVVFTGTPGADDVQLRVNSGGLLEYSDNAGASFTSQLGGGKTLTVSGTTEISIDLKDGNNSVTLNSSLLTALGTTGKLTYIGGSGSDLLALSGSGTNTWKLSDVGAGVINKIVTFTGVETARGGSGTDDLTAPAATTSGSMLEWTLTGPNTGDISSMISFQGMENLHDGVGYLDVFTIASAGKIGTIYGTSADKDAVVLQVDASEDAAKTVLLGSASASVERSSSRDTTSATTAAITAHATPIHDSPVNGWAITRAGTLTTSRIGITKVQIIRSGPPQGPE